MKKYFVAIIIGMSAFLLCGTNQSFAGDRAGNGGGGDLFFNHFIRHLGLAKSVLEVTRPEWIYSGTRPDVIDFYKAHQRDMIVELDSSPMELRHENPSGRCAETGFTPKSTIFISKTECGTIDSLTSMRIVELLLGEVTHHFGKNDKFASLVAIAVTAFQESGKTFRKSQGRGGLGTGKRRRISSHRKRLGYAPKSSPSKTHFDPSALI